MSDDALTAGRTALEEAFAGGDLDPGRWSPFYVPHWSSRAEAAATYRRHDGELHLTIPPDQPRWCADLHDEPLRVSAIQSAGRSGPVGSTAGQPGGSPGSGPVATGSPERDQSLNEPT